MAESSVGHPGLDDVGRCDLGAGGIGSLWGEPVPWAIEGHSSPIRPDGWAEGLPAQPLSALPLRKDPLIPWVSYLISLKFCFLFCKMNTRIVSAS